MGFDIAAGLGNQVSVVGLSGDAVVPAWMAQHRGGIECVVLVSPFFGVHGQPVALMDALAAVLARAPNVYLWWNPKAKEALAGPTHVYPRFGTRYMGDTLELSRDVRAHLASSPFASGAWRS